MNWGERESYFGQHLMFNSFSRDSDGFLSTVILKLWEEVGLDDSAAIKEGKSEIAAVVKKMIAAALGEVWCTSLEPGGKRRRTLCVPSRDSKWEKESLDTVEGRW